MKKIILLLLVAGLSGCGIFKQVHKEKESLKTDISQSVKKDSSTVMVDKSVITVKEKIDTVVTVPEKVVKQDTYLNMDSLINGMTAVKNDLVNVSIILNPITHVLSAVATLKSQLIPLKIDKQTITQNNITEAGKVSSKTKTDNKIDSSHSIVDKKPVNTFWFVVIGLGIVAIISGFAYMYFKR